MDLQHVPAVAGATAVGCALAHESAALHVSGRATYIDDLPELAGTLHAAVGLAERAHARLLMLDLDAVRSASGVVTVLCAADIPGENNCGPVLHDDPILAADEVVFHAQPLFAVAALSREQARRALRHARVAYAALPALTTTAEAVAAQSWVLPPVALTRGDVDAAFARAPRRLAGRRRLGGQEHFYLEGQVAYAVPGEDGSMTVFCSTQHPTEMQHVVAHALGLGVHAVRVECRRLGGGFGGKESQSAQWAAIAALLARRSGRPVKLRLDRDVDMLATGKRHDFDIGYEAGFDHDGRLHALRFELASRCGHSADLSGPVNDRAMFHLDNAYYLDAVAIRSVRARTHTVSNTAFRGFGGPQGMFAIEYLLDDVARSLGRDPLAVRQANFYGGPGRDTTHYGMPVADNVIAPLVAQLAARCRYAERRAATARFNAASPVLKRGLALTPVKFGISFTATALNQAGALVHVYTDGTVLVNHGGTEMGQGLHTKVAQLVAEVFGLPPAAVRVGATDTAKVPNTSATAASAGTDLNGRAAQRAAAAVRARIAAHLAPQAGVAAQAVRFEAGRVRAGALDLAFAAAVMQCYRARVQLWDAGYYATPKIHYDPQTLQGRPFYYFAYGACCAEVAIDSLSGETRVLRADILHDVGRSLNPALDRGQIEGGFIQGLGWLTSEELWWQPEGEQAGRLMTHAPSTYKIPTAADLPSVLNVELFDNHNTEDNVGGSKAVGEPPLMLALAAFFAIRDAVAACGAPGCLPPLDAPATPEAVLRAVSAVRGAGSMLR